jgi:hypothetical protein
VAEISRPPVAIRIVRPYETEDELLEHELDTIGKTSVVLIGAHPRPTGVILRFEVTLASGPTVLRGEGRVLAHKENAFRGQPGLILRFTRLDPKSKAFVDRATSMREARASIPPSGPSSSPAGSAPAPPAPAPSVRAPAARPPTPRPDSAVADALSSATPAPAPAAPIADQEDAVASARAVAREKANATARANAKRTGPPPGLTPPPVPAAVRALQPEVLPPPPPEDRATPSEPEAEAQEAAAPPPEPTPVTSIPGAVAEIPRMVTAKEVAELPIVPSPQVEPPPQAAPAGPAMPPAAPATQAAPAATDTPPNREELLARLRDRAGRLPRERVEEILASRASR